jgi:HUS1 checkpoint protein
MRFKAKLAPEQVSLFHSIIVPMTRLNGGSGGSGDTTAGTSRTTTKSGLHKTSAHHHHTSSSSSQHNLYTSSSFARNGTILYFDTDHVRISCKGNNHNSNSVDSGITSFVELNAQGYSSIFLDRRIESVAPNNAIVMEIDILQLRIALKSVLGNTNDNGASTWNDAQRYVVIKLAKRQNIPCLCIDACSISSSSSAKSNQTASFGNSSSCTIQVHHAIPVRILRHTEMTHHLPPPMQQSPTVQLEIVPSSYNLRTVVDRLKHISSTIYLEANNKGELTISAHTDGASIQTYFSKFVPRFDSNANESSSPAPQNASILNKTARIKLDTKKLAASLQWQHPQHPSSSSSTNPNHQLVSSALLCLMENEMVVVHVNLYPMNVGFITYYVPVHYLSNDPYDD